MRLGEKYLISSSFQVSDDELTWKRRVQVHLLVRAPGLAEQGLPFIFAFSPFNEAIEDYMLFTHQHFLDFFD